MIGYPVICQHCFTDHLRSGHFHFRLASDIAAVYTHSSQGITSLPASCKNSSPPPNFVTRWPYDSWFAAGHLSRSDLAETMIDEVGRIVGCGLWTCMNTFKLSHALRNIRHQWKYKNNHRKLSSSVHLRDHNETSDTNQTLQAYWRNSLPPYQLTCWKHWQQDLVSTLLNLPANCQQKKKMPDLHTNHLASYWFSDGVAVTICGCQQMLNPCLVKFVTGNIAICT